MQSAKSILFSALDIEDQRQRVAFLDEACRDDDALRAEVEALLQSELADDGLFSQAVERLNPNLASDQPNGAESLSVGPLFDVSTHPLIDRYKLLEEIGRGGMGTVYMAQQIEPVRRRVALKVINPGMDSREVIARFEAERQALAMMDHPNIARVLDAGTTKLGHPYFVMDLVRGLPITEYCEKHEFSIEHRLRLFIDLCQAVQHAHQKGIIHRDLKPSNAHVTHRDGEPVVKVIDFGVAKALTQELTERTLYTQFSQLIGTPLYMSPEQADRYGIDVDTRSDVYSLGVLLYELLTGTTPFDRDELSKAGIDGTRQMICEVDPPCPSMRLSTLKAADDSTLEIHREQELKRRKLASTLRGDLDWIVMKALEKNRDDRYQSANELALDIQRYLGGEPVEARPPTKFTKLVKWARRNRALSIGVAASAATIAIVSFGVLIWSNLVITQERNDKARALEERTEALQRADASMQQLVDLYLRALLMVGGEPQLQRYQASFLSDALDFYDVLLKEQPDNPELFLFRANIHWGLGNWESAIRDYTTHMKQLSDVQSNSAPHYAYRGNSYIQLHRYEEALADLDIAIELEPDNSLAWSYRAYTHFELGNERLALADSDRAVSLAPNVSGHWCTRGSIHYEMGSYDQAMADLDRAIELAPNYYVARVWRGRTLYQLGRYEEALVDLYRAARSLIEDATGRRHLGSAHFKLKNYDAALTDYRKAVALGDTFIWRPTENLLETPEEFREGLVSIATQIVERTGTDVAYHDRGHLYMQLNNPERALLDFAKSIDLDPGNTHNWETRGACRAHAFAELGRWNEAIADFEKGKELFPKEPYGHYVAALAQLGAGNIEAYRVGCNEMINRFAVSEEAAAGFWAAWTCALSPEALSDLAPAISLARRAVDSDPLAPNYLQSLGTLLFRNNQTQSAIKYLSQAARNHDRSDPKIESSPAYAYYFLSMAHFRLKNITVAEQWLAKADAQRQSELSDDVNPPAWNRRLTLKLLHDEAKRSLEKAQSEVASRTP